MMSQQPLSLTALFEELSKVLGEKHKIFSLLGRRDACDKLVEKAVSLMGDHPNDVLHGGLYSWQLFKRV